MTASFILLSAVLCIAIALFSYSFYSLPFVSRILRAKEKRFFDLQLLLMTLLFYTLIFAAVEGFFLYQEGYSFFAFSWQVQGFFFCGVTALVLGSIRFSAGDLSISAPHYYVEKLLPLYADFETDSVLLLELIVDLKGELILEALDKKIIISRLPLASFEGINSSQEVMIECTFSERFLKSALVQIVCYPASRGVFIEKTTMNVVLNYLEFRYTEKILKLLS